MTATSGRIRFNPSPVTVGNMRSALAMHCCRILRMHCRVARAVRVTHERPKIQPVVAGNFTPALSGLVCRDNVVETLA